MSRTLQTVHRPRYTGQTRLISTTAPLQKSALPLPDDDDLPANATTSTPFLLADIGEGISEVELLQWHVAPGEAVSQFDRVCEVQSDKASVEITSRYDGVVESLCGEVGEMMYVGKPLLYIATEGGVGGGTDIGGGGEGEPQAEAGQPATLHNVDDEEDRLSVPSAGSNYASHVQSADEKSDSNDSASEGKAKVLTSPAVRKLGKENGIDLSTVQGTGPQGRVLKADVLKIINANSSATDDPPTSAAASLASAPSVATPSRLEEDEVIPVRGYHRLMVKSMTASLQVPHMVYADEINVDALTSVRDSLRPVAKDLGVTKLTYLPFFVKAASLAMNEYPALNATIDVDEMTLTHHQAHNIGVAVDTARGLAVPVVRNCQERSVLEIAAEMGRLFALAAEGNLSEGDIGRPTFTLSNIGAIGGTYMSPVVLPPQVAIGAMGKIQRLPRFVSDDSDEVVAARIMPISWGGDHRAIDGATMARFGNLWKSYVENPSSMMFAMR
ncbi:hypothetical protein ACHAXT_011182 [Thalassiosira profunda]